MNLYLHSENVRIFGVQEPRVLPVVILSGFLGSGKTTLLKHLLKNKQNLKIAAAINDFGEINIDSDLIEHTRQSNKTVQLSNGCVCCSVLSDLKDTVWNLLQENDRTFEYDYLVIETSGVTDPRKIVETLDASFGKMYRARLDNVVCVVDCESWSDDSVASQNQIRSADTIVLNKIDLIAGKGGKVGEGEAWQKRMDELTERICKYTNRETVKILRASFGKVPVDQMLDVMDGQERHAMGKEGTKPITHEKTDAPYYVNKVSSGWHEEIQNLKSLGNLGDHLKKDSFQTNSIVDATRPILVRDFMAFVEGILPNSLARAKGILWLCEERGEAGIATLWSGSGASSSLRSYRTTFHMSGRSPGR